MKKLVLYLCILIGEIINMNDVQAQEFSKLLDGYQAYNRFWGSILVMHDGKVLFQKNYGYSNYDSKQKNNANTFYNLASVTKTITAAAILKLHDEGKLNIYDRVDKYLPNFIDDQTQDIRIINLLNHTSGMTANICQSDDQGNGLVLPDKNPVTRDSLIAKFKHTALKFKPGTKFEYNNYAYTLLAFIVEQVSGTDFATYLNKEIFLPSNMHNTFFKPNLPVVSSTGYSGIGTNNIQPVNSEEYNPTWILGAGGMYSTADDMSKFINSVFSNKLFSEKTKALMLDTCVESSFPGVKWTLGWSKHSFENETYYTHGGSDNGYSTQIVYIPSKNISVIILSNLVKDLKNESIKGAKFSFVEDISENILKLLYNKEVTFLPVPVKSTNKSIVGMYNLDESNKISVSFKDNSLILTFDKSSLFDYIMNAEVKETSENISTCHKFSTSIVSGEFEGFEKYVSDDMRKNLFNKESIAKLTGGWNYITAQSGKYISNTIYNVKKEQGNTNYYIAYHFEKNEIVTVLSFNDTNVLQGLFILNVLPKCNIAQVELHTIGENKYFVDGYRYGGYKDYIVLFDKEKQKIIFKTDDEEFFAFKTK